MVTAPGAPPLTPVEKNRRYMRRLLAARDENAALSARVDIVEAQIATLVQLIGESFERRVAERIEDRLKSRTNRRA